MRLYIDLDSERAVLRPGTLTEAAALWFKRMPLATLEVQFVRAGSGVELPLDATGKFEIKNRGKYDADPLTGAADWVKFGSGVATYYAFTFPLINDALDDEFNVDGNPANDVEKLEDLMCEVSWRYDTRDHKTQTLDCVINNDVNREDDEIPDPIIIYPRNVLVVEVVGTGTVPKYQMITAGGARADSSVAVQAGHVLGLALEDVEAGFAARVAVEGEIEFLDWAWSGADMPLFINGNELSTTAPTSGGFCQQVGITRSATVIYLDLREPVQF